ncbi:PQQ-dependent sugar dehydrogenase [Marinobacter sp.]|uniref:PQQ-dependent sugar dehydrogenase n=1 Tax=Marinobacter sp. TaxID=50741 RepID=UPI0034A2B2C6
MENHVGWRTIIVGFALAWMFGVFAGTLVQTQFNLLALQALGVEIGFGAWLETSIGDLKNFAPLYAVLFGASFLVSQPVAAWLVRRFGFASRAPFLALGAAVGLWVTFTLVDALAPMPTLIAATRGAGGLLAMLMTAAVSGWMFAALASKHPSRRGGGNVLVLLAVASGGLVAPDQSLAEQGTAYQVTTMVRGLDHPWSLAFLPDGRALVTERPGRLRIIDEDGTLHSDPVIGVPKVFVSGQSGLFDVLVAPDFEQSRQVFLAYACGTAAANHTCMARGRLDQSRLSGVEEIFRSYPAKKGDAHYGGRMVWLPDGSLILSLGDGFDYREEAQKLSSHIGTLVRVERDGSAPADNPYIGSPDALPEIFSYGHRNVQGLVFDEKKDRLIAHEHGPRGGDEINIIEAGKNYGWPVITKGLDYTGARVSPFTEYDGMESPALHWTPSIAPSGMALYNGDLFPDWSGSLLVGALAAKSVHRVVVSDDGAVDMETLFNELNERIRDVRAGPDGALYLLTDSPQGRILRISPE